MTPTAQVDDMLAQAAPAAQPLLRRIRAAAKASVPGAVDCVGYQMPALRLRRVFLYYAAFRKHVGVYPPVADAALAAELAPYRGPKGNLQFPFDVDLSDEVLCGLAVALAHERG